MRKTCAFFLAIATSFAVQAEISTGSANVNVRGGGNVVFPEQDGTYSGVRVVAQMRETDPTIMDVTYIVYKNPEMTQTVNVRALAFENGDRGFATVVRPETFVEGTETNIGDGIAANIEHRLSWNVPSDWATDLAKVNFEVMAMKPGDLLLPGMHFVTIPAAEGHPKTIVSVNDTLDSAYQITQNQDAFGGLYRPWWSYLDQANSTNMAIIGHRSLFQALLWLYANGENDLSLINGALKSNAMELVRHAAFVHKQVNIVGYTINTTNYVSWSFAQNAFRYVFEKMGYKLLESESEIAWINENTRLGLQPQQFRQYAVKTVDE